MLKKSRKVNKGIKNQYSLSISMLSNSGSVSAGGTETTPTRGKAAELFCKWSQPDIMHLRDEGIARLQTVGCSN